MTQCISVFIILGRDAQNKYSANLSLLILEALETRRDKICVTKFAQKVFKHPVHKNMFDLADPSRTRSKRRVNIPFARTKRYDRSSLPSLARIINYIN